MHVLIVEDDTETAEFLVRSLQEAGDSAESCETAEQALIHLQASSFDSIVFDRMLPGMDGMEMVRQLRERQITTPVIMLTALSGLDDRIDGLNAGADDYMVKPFAFSELYARLQAMQRRNQIQADANQLQVGDLTLERATQKVTRNNQDIALSRREYKILELLMQNAGQVVTQAMLLEKVWGYAFDPHTSLVQTHVSRLRTKVDKPFDLELIQTLRGTGYVIGDPAKTDYPE